MRRAVFACGVLSCALLFAGCAKEDVVKKDESLMARPETVTPSEAERKAAEQKAAEQKAEEQRIAAQKAAEQKAAEQKAAEQKAAEQKITERDVTGEPAVGTAGAGREETAAGTTIAGQELQKVYFDYDSVTLSDAARDSLQKNFELLKKSAATRVQLEGHCDERGSDEYNLALGERRAKSAKSYLMTLGIKPDRLQTLSYGKEKPADPGHDEAAWAKNRRVEFVIVK